MTTSRKAALAIVSGSAAGLITMVLHPSGRDVISNASAGNPNTLNVAVHTLAIVAQPLVLAGALALTTKLRTQKDIAIAAFVYFAMASVAVTVAAIASGYLAPASLDGYASANEVQRRAMLGSLRYTGLLNQTFAKVHVVLSSIAILLWSIAIIRGRELPRWLGLYGVVLATLLMLGIGSGRLALDIHGFGLVVLTQGVWLILAARELWNSTATTLSPEFRSI